MNSLSVREVASYTLGYFKSIDDCALTLKSLDVNERTIELMKSELWRQYVQANSSVFNLKLARSLKTYESVTAIISETEFNRGSDSSIELEDSAR